MFGTRICVGFFHVLLNLHPSHRMFGGRIVVRSPSCPHVRARLRGLYGVYGRCTVGRELTSTPGCVHVFTGGKRSSIVTSVDTGVRLLVRRLSGDGSKMLLRCLGGCPVLSAGTRGDPFSGR